MYVPGKALQDPNSSHLRHSQVVRTWKPGGQVPSEIPSMTVWIFFFFFNCETCSFLPNSIMAAEVIPAC